MAEKPTTLITGGAGSVGSVLVEALLRRGHIVRSLDINEDALFKQQQAVQDLRQGFEDNLRILLGDIRDQRRVCLAMSGCQVVWHLAALKNIAISEHNPFEAIRTNVYGSGNVVRTALRAKNLETFHYVSTDKAVAPTTLYGLTKRIGEDLTLWASDHSDKHFDILRMGNVWGTRGSVSEVWAQQLRDGRPLSVTDRNMRRYRFENVEVCVSWMLKAVQKLKSGEIGIPKMELVEIDAEARRLSDKILYTGRRKGEKLCEELTNPWEQPRIRHLGDTMIVKRGGSGGSGGSGSSRPALPKGSW